MIRRFIYANPTGLTIVDAVFPFLTLACSDVVNAELLASKISSCFLSHHKPTWIAAVTTTKPPI